MKNLLLAIFVVFTMAGIAAAIYLSIYLLGMYSRTALFVVTAIFLIIMVWLTYNIISKEKK